MHGYDGWNMGGMWMGGMWFWWILITVAIVAVVWMAISFSRRGNNSPGESPEQILKHRFAKGEIKQEQYELMLSELRE